MPMERRSNKDRRKHVDPRYKDPACPEFVDRRSGRDRRVGDYQHLPGHPNRKWIILIGIVVALCLVYFCLFTSFLLTKNHRISILKKTVTLGHNEDDIGNYPPPLGNALCRKPELSFHG